MAFTPPPTPSTSVKRRRGKSAPRVHTTALRTRWLERESNALCGDKMSPHRQCMMDRAVRTTRLFTGQSPIPYLQNFKVLRQTTLRLSDFGIIMRDSQNAIYSFLRTLTSQPPALNAVGAKHPLSSRAASPSPLVPLSVWHIGTFGPFGSLAHCRLLVPCLSLACLPISRQAQYYRDVDKLGYQFFPVLLTPIPKSPVLPRR